MKSLHSRLLRFLPRRGMMLAELLISVSITAMLLTAMSGVFMSVSQSVRVNDQFSRASQAGRSAMVRLTRDVRTSDACQVGTSQEQGASRVTSNLLEVVTLGQQTIEYRFDADARTLTMTTDGGTPVVLVRNVTGRFSSVIEDAGDGARQTVSVSIALTVSDSAQSVSLNGSVTPRRSMN
ncbi:MAG TPA: hypothetical protein VGB55_07155 [Tepidisphaeraceae bacterium]|jgi:Tfp pilus assembly protein PilW